MTARELDELVASAAAPTPEAAEALRAFAERVETEKRAEVAADRQSRRERERLGIFAAYPTGGQR